MSLRQYSFYYNFTNVFPLAKKISDIRMQIPQKLRISNSVKLYSINSSCGYVVDSKRRQNTDV